MLAIQIGEIPEVLDKCIACYPMEEQFMVFSFQFKLLISLATTFCGSLQIIAR